MPSDQKNGESRQDNREKRVMEGMSMTKAETELPVISSTKFTGHISQILVSHDDCQQRQLQVIVSHFSVFLMKVRKSKIK